MLVNAVIDHDPFTEMLSERDADHDAIVSALDRAIDKLANEKEPQKKSEDPGE